MCNLQGQPDEDVGARSVGGRSALAQAECALTASVHDRTHSSVMAGPNARATSLAHPTLGDRLVAPAFAMTAPPFPAVEYDLITP
jgi:hypothetical protein